MRDPTQKDSDETWRRIPRRIDGASDQEKPRKLMALGHRVSAPEARGGANMEETGGWML